MHNANIWARIDECMCAENLEPETLTQAETLFTDTTRVMLQAAAAADAGPKLTRDEQTKLSLALAQATQKLKCPADSHLALAMALSLECQWGTRGSESVAHQ